MAEQELDSLLIKIDSELGDLRGINSAISALNRLAGITQNAKGAIKQLSDLGDALQHFNGLGYKLSGLNETESGIHRMITALQRLSEVTKSADKGLTAFARLGDTLNSSFNNVGRNLAGLEEASRGVANLVSVLNDLSKVATVRKSKFESLGTLGQTLKDSFSGVGESLKGIEQVSWGVVNLSKALKELSEAGSVKSSTISNLANLADAIKNFKDVSQDLENIVEPVRNLLNAVGNLGNNNKVSIKVDKDGIANVRQVLRNTRKDLTSFQDFLAQTRRDRLAINFSDMFDITRPTNELEDNLNRARHMLTTFESNARKSLESVHNLTANFSMADLQNNVKFRNAFRANVMSDVMAQQMRDGIDAISNELETRGTHEVQQAWAHTLQTIQRDTQRFRQSNVLQDLLNINAPTEQLRANLRTVQNELSRAMNAMERAQQNMQRLRAQEPDQNRLQGNAGYRGSYYTWRMNARYVEEYRRAVQLLNRELRQRENLPQSDVEGLRQLPQLTQQLERYRDIYNQLQGQGNLTDEQMRNLTTLERGIDIIAGRIDAIRGQLEQIPPSEEGILERMRQIGDATERVNRQTAEMNANLRQSAGQGFGAFGSMLSGSGNQILGSLGNLSSMFGQAVSNGTARLSTEALQGLQGVSSTLGTIATAVGQVTAVVGVAVAVFQTWWRVMSKVKSMLEEFVQKCIQFAKNMLSKVVGAFNAVAGAVSKTISAVKSGVQILASALRKIEDIGKGIINVFGKIGGAIQPALKGMKGILSLVTPRIAKTLASANGSLKDIIKNTRLLNKALQVANKWFTMLTRMLMRKIVQAFISSVKDAFDNMILFEKNAEDAMLRLNNNVSYVFSAFKRLINQIVAIFEPVINAMAEPMENFLDSMTLVAENFSKMMAILTGQPYYLRAKKFYEDYGENVDETRKKVKQLTNGLDELNILSENKDDSDEDWKDRWEKVPVDGIFEIPTIQDLIDKIVDFLKNIDWEYIWDKIREIIHKAMEVINEFLARLDLWEWLGKTIGNLFNTLMVAFNQFLRDFDPKLLADAIATLIINALRTIDWDLIHENVELLAKKIAEFWNEIFANDELWDEVAKTVTNFLNEIVHYFNTFAWTFDFKQMAQQLTDTITKILKGFDWEQLRSAVEGWVRGLVDFINTAIANKEFWKTLGETIKNIINNVIIEAFKQLAKLDLVGLSDSLKKMIQNALDGIKWDEFEKSIRTFFTNMAEAINNFFGDEEFLTKVTTGIANFSNAVIHAIDDFLKELQSKDIASAITNAFITGFNSIDWDTAFLIPAEALNSLTEAIRGLLDSLPDGVNIADWLISHLTITYDAINWAEIQQNLRDIFNLIVDTINGIISDGRFWDRLQDITIRGLNIIVDFTESVKKIDWDGLAERIVNYVNSVVKSGKIQQIITNIGKITIDLFFTISAVITGIDWTALGEQIASGIRDVIDELYEKRALIQKAIEDAFTSFSELISSILQTLLKSNSFYKFGTLMGNVLLGIINGVSIFFEDNTGNIIEAMKQFANGMADFIRTHKWEIINALNSIIDNIVAILDSFFDEKGVLFTQINDVIAHLKLGKLFGALLGSLIRIFTATLKTFTAIDESLKKDLDEFVDELAKALKGLFKYVFDKLVEKLTDPKFWLENMATPVGLGQFIAKIVLAMFGDAEQIKNIIWTALKAVFPPLNLVDMIIKLLLGDKNGEKKTIKFGDLFNFNFGDVKQKFSDALSGVKDFFGGLFGNKKGEAVDVPVNPVVDDENKSKIKIETTEYGTIYADKIKADLIEVKDIIADKLKIKKIESDTTGKKMDEFFSGNDINVQSGTLTRDPSYDKILAKVLEVTEKITAPLLEIADKITAKLIEVAEKITVPLLEIAEKITTPLLEAMQIVASLITANQMTVSQISAGSLSVSQINTSNLNVASINSSLLTVGSVVASTLKVGVIQGSISGTTGTTGYGTSYGGYISKPTFNQGGRWSDITGLVPSAEDFLDTFSDTYNTYTGGSVLGGRRIGSGNSNVVQANVNQNAKTDDITLDSNAKYIRDYLMSFIGNENGVYGLMGNLYEESKLKSNNLQDSGNKKLGMTDEEYTAYINRGGNFIDNIGYGLAQWTTGDRKQKFLDSLNGRSVDDLDAQLEFLKSELQSSEYASVLDKLKNATSIHEASTAVLTGYEKPKDTMSHDALRWHYSEGIAKLLDEGEDQYDTEDTSAETPFDEANVLGDKREGSGSLLDLLPTLFNYRMAEVYDIIDTWFGRIKQLVDSFMSYLYDKFSIFNMTGGAFDFTALITEIRRGNDSILQLLNSIYYLLNNILIAIQSLATTVRSVGKDIVNAIKKIKTVSSSFDFAKLDDLMGDHCVHLQNKMNEHCIHICDAISKLGNGLKGTFGNITCNCNCNCSGNCGTCPAQNPTKQQTVVKDPIPNYPSNVVDTETGTVTRPTNPSNPSGGKTGGTSNGTGGGSNTSGTKTTDTGGGKGDTGNGNRIYWTNADGSRATMFAMVNGQMVQLSDNLPADLKDQIARGMYPICDREGNYLSAKDRKSLLKYLVAKGWLLDSNGTTKGSTGGTGLKGTTGTGLKGTKGTKGVTGGTRIDDDSDPASQFLKGLYEGLTGGKDNDVNTSEVGGGNGYDDEPAVSGARRDETKGGSNPWIYDPETGKINLDFDAGGNGDEWIDKLDNEGITKDRGTQGTRNNGGKGSTDYSSNSPSGSKSSQTKSTGSNVGGVKGSGSGTSGGKKLRHLSDDWCSDFEKRVVVPSTGMTNYYDGDGNLIMSVPTADIVAKKKEKEQEKLAEKQKKRQEKLEEKKKKAQELKDQRAQAKAEKQAQDKKDAQQLKKDAKKLLDKIKKNGSATQIKLAEMYYGNLDPDNRSLRECKTFYRGLEKLAEKAEANPTKKDKTSDTTKNGTKSTGTKATGTKGDKQNPVLETAIVSDDLNNTAKSEGEKNISDIKDGVDDIKNTVKNNQNGTSTNANNSDAVAIENAKNAIVGAINNLKNTTQNAQNTTPIVNAINDLKSAIRNIECTCDCSESTDVSTEEGGDGSSSGGSTGSGTGTGGTGGEETSYTIEVNDEKDKSGGSTSGTGSGTGSGSTVTVSTEEDKGTGSKVGEATVDTTPTSGNTEDTKRGAFADKFVKEFKSAVDSGEHITTDAGGSWDGHPATKSFADDIANGKRSLSFVAFGKDNSAKSSNNSAYKLPDSEEMELFNYWYKNRFLVKGYQMGGIPSSGELFMARENGNNEFIGSFGNKSVVANNDQIVTAVANGVSMANDRIVGAIENQTARVETAIDRKNVDVVIGDRQIAEANNRGQQSLGNKFVD